MIYIDTSVALAQRFAKDVRPPAWLWAETLVTSRLLEYELWTRVNGRSCICGSYAAPSSLACPITHYRDVVVNVFHLLVHPLQTVMNDDGQFIAESRVV